MTTWKRPRVVWRLGDDMEDNESDVEVRLRYGRNRE